MVGYYFSNIFTLITILKDNASFFPPSDHPCSSSHGGCSHLCLVRPDGYRCSCPDYLPSGEVCNSSGKLKET